MEGKVIDARGLSCPQPAMLARQAMQKAGKGTLEVLVDSGTARENVSRLAKNAGWEVTIEAQPDGSYRIVLNK
ncbi:MAG: sulfurtransferase TusA family protein [Dehalococcoidales bacterium]|jgi:TusA-related sulfurtransferase|nr:sulfurtransferase TusA family protein [Dehalococcoidales bacterium]